jgi:hypothetical protein
MNECNMGVCVKKDKHHNVGWGGKALFSPKTEGCEGQGSVFSEKKLMGVQMKAKKVRIDQLLSMEKMGAGQKASTSARSFVALPDDS